MIARLSVSLASGLFLLLGSLGADVMAQDAAGYGGLVDDATGIRITLPLKLLPRVADTAVGRNWASADKAINVDTFAYPKDQSFDQLHARLKGVRGRTLSRDERSEDRFVIAGRDRDGSGFHVEVRRSGDRIRGFSIVYAAKRSQEAAAIVKRIAASFDPFPVAAGVPPDRAPTSRAPALAVPGPAECAKEREALQELASRIGVTFDRSGTVKAGEPVSVAWHRGSERFPLNRPVHLVFAMPETVRFSGQHILPILPNGRSPSSIEFGAGQLRVFLPLAQRSVPESGTFVLTPHRAGPFPITSAVVAKTACGETVLAQTGTASLEVEPGPPRLVIQDFFSVEQPDRVVLSSDGRYRLETFKASYRVYEVASGIKIVDRAGRHPNFSPAARYVAAYLNGSESTGGRLEVIDLVTAMPIPGLNLIGPIVAWGLGDSALVEGTVGHPVVRIRFSLVNPTLRKPSPQHVDEAEVGLVEMATSGRGSSAWERFRVKLLLEQSLAVIEDYFPPEKEARHSIAVELASGTLVDEKLVEDRRRLALEGYGIAPIATAPGWDLGEPLQLSHYSPQIDAILADLTEKDDKGRRVQGPAFPRQRPFLVVHRERANEGAVKVAAPLATTVVRGLDWRTRAAGEGPQRATGDDTGRFAEQLAHYGICVRPGCRRVSERQIPTSFVTRSEFLASNYQYGTQTTAFTTPPAQIEQDLIRDVPVAGKLLGGAPNRICYQEEPEKDDVPIEKRMKFRMIGDEKGHTDVHGVWSWSLDLRKFWLVQAVCSHAGILNSPVMLFASEPGGPGAIHLLGGNAQVGAGLNKNFEAAPNEAVLRIKPSIIDGRWLLIAAPAGNSAAIVDLETPTEPVFIHNVKDAFAVAALLRTGDGRQLVQLNTDGRFYVYRTADSQQVISGRWIDDEMVLVTERGYYDGSYEGGHFVHVGFAGDEDIYSLAQFEKALKRPDVVKDVVAGKTRDGPELALNVPPSVAMELDRTGSALTVRMQIRAGSGLKAVRLFDDGELIKEISLQGRAASPIVTFDRPPKGRWLAAIAEDHNGLFSAPTLIANPAPAVDGRTLHAVVIGVDRYEESELKLNYARSDARRLSQALRSGPRDYYAQVEVTELSDELATSEAILAALETVVRKAKSDDVILFSFAGHGVQGGDGQLYLTPSGFNSANAMKTGLAWSRIATVLRRSPARILVALDACHAGAAGISGVASNDEAVSVLLSGRQAPMIVFAASKGRQLSHEDIPGQPARWSGGAFTYALVRALTEDRRSADLDGNGVLEVSELYRAVKSRVVEETQGEQTPWLVRQDIVGDFALF